MTDFEVFVICKGTIGMEFFSCRWNNVMQNVKSHVDVLYKNLIHMRALLLKFISGIGTNPGLILARFIR